MQLLLYKKESGQIVQVMEFRSNVKPDIQQLGNRFDFDKIGICYEESNRFIDIRRDRVLDGEISYTSPVNHVEKRELETEQIFETVKAQNPIQKRCHIGIVTTWKQQCGIAEYSEDLTNNLLNKVTILAEKGYSTEGKHDVVACWGRDDSDYNSLFHEIKKRNIDIVHVQYNHGLMNPTALQNLAKDLRLNKIHTVITLHSTKGGVHVFADNFEQILVHSNASKQDMLDEGVEEDQLVMIRIGSKIQTKPKTMIQARQNKGLDFERAIISTFGFLLPQKGVKEAIQAINIIKEEYPDVLFIACCAIHYSQNESVSKKYHKECLALIKELKLEQNVQLITEFLSFDEVYDYLCASNVISLAYTNSAAQATSSAGRTALASLRPVVASKTEIFDDLQGVVPRVEPHNIELLAETILTLLTSKKQQQQLISSTKCFLRDTSWYNIAKAHSLFYRAFGDLSIHIEGQVYSYFSASIVNRRLACALDEIGVDVSLSSVNMAENLDYELGDNSREIIQRERNKTVCVRHFYPPKFSNMDAQIKVMYLPVETTSVPNKKDSKLEEENWIENINKHTDYVWTYTNHGKNILEQCGIEKPVYVIPCGFDEHLFDYKSVSSVNFGSIRDSATKKTVHIDEDTFIFLFCGHAQKRKNFDVILKAYFEEFTAEDNVVCIFKSYDGGEVHKLIEDTTKKIALTKESIPRYLYIYEDSSPEVIPRYYYTADCMVQCSRAEGFGLPILEAMAVGTPSIATPWGGPLDFTNKDNCFYVPFRLVESDYHVQSKDNVSYWAEVEVTDLMQVMRFVYDNGAEVERRGQNGLRDSKSWTSKQCAFPVVEFLRDIQENVNGNSKQIRKAEIAPPQPIVEAVVVKEEVSEPKIIKVDPISVSELAVEKELEPELTVEEKERLEKSTVHSVYKLLDKEERSISGSVKSEDDRKSLLSSIMDQAQTLPTKSKEELEKDEDENQRKLKTKSIMTDIVSELDEDILAEMEAIETATEIEDRKLSGIEKIMASAQEKIEDRFYYIDEE